MTTVLIPKGADKNKSLIAIPHKLYEEFLSWQKKVKLPNISKPTADEKKAIRQGRDAIKRGDYVSLSQARKELGI